MDSSQRPKKSSGDRASPRDLEFIAASALDMLQVSVAIVDHSVRILRANKRFRETFKISDSQARGYDLFKSHRALWRIRPLREKILALARGGDPSRITNAPPHAPAAREADVDDQRASGRAAPTRRAAS